MLAEDAVKEFNKIYQKKFGVLLSLDEASLKAENFLKLMVLITGGMKDEKDKL